MQKKSLVMDKLKDLLTKYNEKFLPLNKRYLSWMKNLSQEHLDRAHIRIEICEQCDRYSKPLCKECDCYMPLKVLWPKGTECPLGKW